MSEPSVSLVTHFKTDHGQREQSWNWLQRKWHSEWPELEIVVGTDSTKSRIYNAAVALNAGVAASHGDVLIVADADVYMPVKLLKRQAVKLATEQSKFVSPWNKMLMLSKLDTRGALHEEPEKPGVLETISDEARARVEPWDHHKAPGSLVMITRRGYDFVDGNDERFLGWGGADKAFWLAVDTLWGRHERAAGDLVHLWHPRLRDSRGNWVWDKQQRWYFTELLKRYETAHRRKAEMKKILAEPRRDLAGLAAS